MARSKIGQEYIFIRGLGDAVLCIAGMYFARKCLCVTGEVRGGESSIDHSIKAGCDSS